MVPPHRARDPFQVAADVAKYGARGLINPYVYEKRRARGAAKKALRSERDVQRLIRALQRGDQS
jgi:hypothetical protein